MAFALRRAFIRSNSSRCSLRSPPLSSQLRARRIPAASARCFTASTRRRQNDDDASDIHTKPPALTKKTNKPQILQEAVASDELGKTEPEISDAAIQEMLVDKFVQSGDLDAAFREVGIDADSVSEADKQELRDLVDQVREANMQDQQLEGFAEAIVADPDDHQAIEDAAKRLNLDTNELMSPMSQEELELLKESGIDPRDKEAMRKAGLRAFTGLGEGESIGEHLKQMGKTPGKSPINLDGDEYDLESLPNLPDREVPGFWNEDKEDDLGPDENFNQDGLPAAGHRELDLHREIREYSRLIVWELPLLSSKF
jgi:hypothetical protein